MKIKPKDLLEDDAKLIYEVVEVFTNSAVVVPFPNTGDFAAEIMTFKAMGNEEWEVVGSLTK